MSVSNGLPSAIAAELNASVTPTVHPATLPNISSEKLKAELQGLFAELSERIAQSVNNARSGHLIDDSEEPVRQAGHEFVRAAFEAAMQQKIDAVEASFSPSGDP
jgi:hypothetical protein